jgi:hypothetical protein
MAVGRFQIMALLQAARAHVLGLPLESAHSWGLNRAIFIAAAKRGFKGGSGGSGSSGTGGTPKKPETYSLGDDMAYTAPSKDVILFTIGGKVQTEEEFEKRVKSRFGHAYQAAWKEALAYVKSFDRQTLESTNEFFSTVYKPVRDSLAEKWSLASEANDK